MTYALGVDTAEVDGNAPPDYAKARDDGHLAFTYLRKCEHVYPDHYYLRDAARARAAGLLVGAYLMPCWTVNAATPKSQVAALKAAPGAIVEGHDLPPALDIESGLRGGFAATGRKPVELVEMWRQFVLEMEDTFGCKPVIYTAYTQFYDLGLPSLPWATECPLWVKTAYPVPPRSPLWTGTPVEPHVGDTADDPRSLHQIPGPWTRSGWMFHQFLGDALGFAGFNQTVDVDYFHTTQRGDKGPHVMWLQRRVNVNDDGDFGPATETAVRAFQTARGLAATGVVDLSTFAAIAWASK